MDNTIQGSAQPFNKFRIPLTWGVIIGIISAILTTAGYVFLINSYMVFLVFSGLIFIGTIVLYGVVGAQQRKAMGGYITFKEAFQAIFIAILISSIISTLYGLLYVKVIDPGVIDKIKTGTLSFMEKMHVPDDKMDKAAADIDERVKDSQRISNIIYAFFKSLVITSIFGFVCAAIVKKKPIPGIDNNPS